MRKPLLFALLLFLLGALIIAGCSAGTAQTSTPAADHPHDVPNAPEAYAGKTNPLSAGAADLEAGQRAYEINCASCHGDTGMGDGPAASGLDPRPHSLAGTTLGDDYLFWRISEGGAMEPFRSAMPSWKNSLSEEQIWQIIAYLRSLKAQ